MKTLFLKSNLLHIRTNEGVFEVSNPEILKTAPRYNNWGKKDRVEWPYGVELIKQYKRREGWSDEPTARDTIGTVFARLLPKEEFKPAQPTPNFPKGGTTFTESAYKEVENNCSKCGHPLNPATAEMCEIVWNTHVVPLQEENQRLKNDLLDALDLKEGNGPTALSMAISENKALREENTRLTTKFIEEEHASESPNDHLSYWQYQQFTRAAITKLKEEISQLKAEVLKEKFPEN